MKKDFTDLPLWVAFVFVVLTAIGFILNEGGAFSMTEEQKLTKMKQCTNDGYGIQANLLLNGKTKEVTCCSKIESNCDFSNLKNKEQ